MAKILVLGGAGFIGYHLVCRLAENSGHQIKIVDNLSRGEYDSDFEALLDNNPRVEFIAGDLTQPDTFDLLGGPFEHVYLLAGIVGVRNVESGPARVIQINTAIILNTLEWVRRVGCGRLFFASTSETYADSVKLGIAGVPTPETTPLVISDIQQPRSTYALSKMLGEAAVSHYSKSYGFQAVIVRFHNIYGPRMGFDHVVPELMERISKQMDPLTVYGLEQTRAFCYVQDAIRSSEALMNCQLDGCEIVHVGNDREEITIRELLEKLLDLVGFHPALNELPAPMGAVPRRCPDVSKLHAMTGLMPRVDIDAGLKLTWEWYRQRLSTGGVTAGSKLRP